MKHLFFFVIILLSFTVRAQKFHTDFKYNDSIYQGLRIQNSYPKGGQRYKASNGKEFVYVIFWTRIINDSSSSLEFSINLPVESFAIPYSPFIEFQLYLPKEKMTVEKESMYNYGLDLQSFLDKNLNKPSELNVTIDPKDTCLFYVVALSSRGVDGVVRAGLELQKQGLIYKINGHAISCGSIVVKK